jgi:hypothetical protein
VPEALCVTEVICLVKRSLRVKYDTEVTEMGIPGGGSMLEADWCWGDRATSRYRISFPNVKRARSRVDHPTPHSAEVKEREELYFYSPLGLHGLIWDEYCPYLYLTQG